MKDNYDNYIEINFENEPEKKKLFSGDLDADSLLDRLAYGKDIRSKKGRKAVFLDEIQNCTGALSALKPLVDDGRFDIIASGSLLGVRIDKDDRLSPAGYVHTVEMFPMDFEEFLWAMGVKRSITDSISESIRNMDKLDDFLLNKTNELFRRYVVVGGMPAAVRTYAETNDYNRARDELSDIINILRSDAVKYSVADRKNRITACFDSLPVQLSSENKKFSYARIEKKRYGSREYLPAIEWLMSSGIAMRCHNVTSPEVPFEFRTDDPFKIYLSDTGILMAMMDPSVAETFVNKDPFTNNGAAMENAVACSLSSKGYGLFYFSKRDSTLETDFLAVMDGKLTAIEVKSGRKKKSKSLRTLISDLYNVQAGVKVSETNVSVDDNGILRLPLFGMCFIEERKADIKAVDGIEEMNELA